MMKARIKKLRSALERSPANDLKLIHGFIVVLAILRRFLKIFTG